MVTKRKQKKSKANKEPNSIKRTFQDGVFCDLFSQAKYTFGLYRELHPEDSTATEEDVEIITVDNVVADTPCNGVGFAVGDSVKVVDGPLTGFIGTVEALDVDKNSVSVVVSMFGRETPVDLELDQVEVIKE